MVRQVERQLQKSVTEEGIDGLNGEATNEFKLKSMREQSFIYSPTHALVSCHKKNSIKIYIKTAPTCFGVTFTLSSGSVLICAY